MSTGLPILERYTSGAPTETHSAQPKVSKPQRVLACILCQQRKVKCDRQFPCANCTKSRVQCVPATLGPRRRRRRFPERELLDRLRRYEDLLRQNNVPFEPLHKYPAEGTGSFHAESGDDSNDEQADGRRPSVSSPSNTVRSDTGYETRSVFHTMSQGFRDPDNDSNSSEDDIRERLVKKAWEEAIESSDHLFFGSRKTPVDLSTIHPDPVQIFRLWQIYLDNVNPLLKVTHTPSLQTRIIEAAGNVTKIEPHLEVLMFGIYCVAMLSMTVEDCQTTFGFSRQDLLTKYQFGCQQALLNCGFLRTSDRNCLTALYLYLISFRHSTVPQSLSPLLGIAIRIARRMGIHSESSLSKCTVLEAEMRRRLWWSLVIFDTRIGELALCEPGTLDPTWDCRIPVNANDADLRPEMKIPPTPQWNCSEAMFAVVRSEVSDFIRHSILHLEFTNPALKAIVKNTPASEGEELLKFEESIENRYLRYCDQENPIHVMTTWTIRVYLAKCRMAEFQNSHSNSSTRWTDAQFDTATSFALKILECDTKIMTSPLTKRFLWLHHFYFPFPAYMQLVQDLKKRPLNVQAQRAWAVMSENYDAWFDFRIADKGQLFHVFTRLVLLAWKAVEDASQQAGQIATPPAIVLSIKDTLATRSQNTMDPGLTQPEIDMDMGFEDFSLSTPVDLGDQSSPYDMTMQHGYPMTSSNSYSGVLAQAPLQSVWTPVHWNTFGGHPGWGGF